MAEKYYHIEIDVRGLDAQEAEALLDVLVAITALKVDENQIASCVVPMDDSETYGKILQANEVDNIFDAQREARMEVDRQREEQWEQSVKDAKDAEDDALDEDALDEAAGISISPPGVG
jgi:hypothetical protein